MKKLLLLLCGLMSLVMSVHAADSKEFDYTHKGNTLKFVILSESERTCAVTGYTSKPVGALELPDCVDYNGIEYSLVEIGREAFAYCRRLTSVEIPNSVITIEEGAFGVCTGLTSIKIPSSVTYLSGFDSCTGLTSVEIPNSVQTIGQSAFAHCNVTSVEIPNSVQTIGQSAFAHCRRLTSVEIPNSVQIIDQTAFCYCSSLKSVEIPNSVTTIGNSAFYLCTGLTSIKIPCSVTTIEEGAFGGCTGLTSIEIPSSVTYLSGFNSCTGLTSIEIPNSVIRIGYRAFEGCAGLTSIEIPNSVIIIDEWAFGGCTGLTSIKLPESLTKIDYWLFRGCTGLTELAIPQSVREIQSSAFDKVPLMKITSYALEPPVLKLDQIPIDDDVLNYGVLYVASKSLDKYKKGWSIFRNIFAYECEERTYTLSSPGTLLNLVNPNDVENITALKLIGSINGTDLLTINRMTNLQKIDLSEATIVSGGKSYYADDNNMWKTENDVLGGYWAYNLDRLVEVVLPENLHTIDARAFLGKILLYSVKIPDSVTGIGDSAFQGCTRLIELNIPETVTTLGSSVFKDCRMLGKVTIPGPITSIGKYVFDGCTRLKEVKVPASVTCIGVSAFRNCKGLTALELPGSLTTIEAGAFQNCFALEKISIPYQLAEIGNSAFEYCISLGSIVLPGSIRKIDAYAFSGCSSLTTVSVINPIPAVIRASTFPTAANELTLVVPEESQGIYWIHPYWGKFGKIETWNATGETDFMADEVMYHITSENDMTVEVCAVSPENGRSAAKSLEIPQTVVFNSRKYTVTGIANNGVANAGVTSVILPATTAYVGLSAFSGNSGLKTIECNAVVPPSVDQSSFDEDVYSSAELLVPLDAEEAYRNDEVWSLFNIKGVEQKILVSELSVNPTEWTGGVGEEFRITATVLPADATCKTLKWSTSDPAVAEVSDDGVVTVTGTGECVITVATVDGSGLTATCHVKIETNGIDSVFERDDHVHIRVYTLAGFCIYDGAADKASLSPGIYIVITADGVEKVVIK